jgi:hypothetical protein
MRPTTRARVASALCLACAVSLACAGPPEGAGDLAWGETAAEESAPLGGQALATRKRELRRAHGDLLHFHATLVTLGQRRERSGAILFSQFLDAYLGLHLGPLLAGEWQSDHPELSALDASVRFAQAEVLILLRDPRRVQDVIDEIERRFEGRENMLVEYPLGSQGTLGTGLGILAGRKWRG